MDSKLEKIQKELEKLPRYKVEIDESLVDEYGNCSEDSIDYSDIEMKTKYDFLGDLVKWEDVSLIIYKIKNSQYEKR